MSKKKGKYQQAAESQAKIQKCRCGEKLKAVCKRTKAGNRWVMVCSNGHIINPTAERVARLPGHYGLNQ